MTESNEYLTPPFGNLKKSGPLPVFLQYFTHFYGERCTEFLFGEGAIKPFRFIWVAVVVIGSVAGDRGVVWGVADTLNGLMALPNLIALLLLSPVVFRLTRAYRFNG